MHRDVRLAIRSLRREPAIVLDVIASFALAVDLFVPLSAALRDRPAEWVSEPGMNLAAVVVRLRAE